jgi:hypothetical protein
VWQLYMSGLPCDSREQDRGAGQQCVSTTHHSSSGAVWQGTGSQICWGRRRLTVPAAKVTPPPSPPHIPHPCTLSVESHANTHTLLHHQAQHAWCCLVCLCTPPPPHATIVVDLSVSTFLAGWILVSMHVPKCSQCRHTHPTPDFTHPQQSRMYPPPHTHPHTRSSPAQSFQAG